MDAVTTTVIMQPSKPLWAFPGVPDGEVVNRRLPDVRSRRGDLGCTDAEAR